MISLFKRVFVVDSEGVVVIENMPMPNVEIPLGWMRECRTWVLDPEDPEWRYDVLYVKHGVEGQMFITLMCSNPDGARELLAHKLAREELKPIHRIQSTSFTLALPSTCPARYV